MSIDLTAVAAAISGTREGLAASGYQIDCNEQTGRLVFTVRALADACEECLVPKPIFTSILRQELGEGELFATIDHIALILGDDEGKPGDLT